MCGSYLWLISFLLASKQEFLIYLWRSFQLKYRIPVCRQLWWREDRGSWCHCRHRRSRATHPNGVARHRGSCSILRGQETGHGHGHDLAVPHTVGVFDCPFFWLVVLVHSQGQRHFWCNIWMFLLSHFSIVQQQLSSYITFFKVMRLEKLTH